ncbi:cytochrome P450 [Apiospora rasikravindrae]|uniref:Cytochrome P450 n=1 Tax=Apiospora rasikravindrae TaxID=990691 RepID=A0ABR1SJZ3_9PEZI
MNETSLAFLVSTSAARHATGASGLLAPFSFLIRARQSLLPVLVLMETPSVGGAVLLGLFVAYAVWSYNSNARRRIPGVHGMGYGHAPFFASWRGAIKFMLRPRYYLLKGYQKYKSGYFKIATLRSEYILVSDKAKISEVSNIKQFARPPFFSRAHELTLASKLLAAPADVLSFLDIRADEIQSKWTLGNSSPWHLGLISGKLTQNIGTLTPGLVKEINVALDKYIGSPQDFAPIALHNVIQKVVAQAVSYAFVGHPLCRDEVYLGNIRAFTRAVNISAELIRPFPDSLKPYLIRLTPAWRRRKFAEEVMHSAVLERLRKTYKAKEAKPVDLLQWLAETAPSRERNVIITVERIMGMNLAAIYDTSSILTGAVIQAALSPDLYTPVLRQEVLAHCENGIVTHKTMLNAPKLDSFVRETGRMNPISMIGLLRVARKELRFRDGTTIPKGTRIGVPTVAIHHDATLYPKPDLFDGFRFSRLREEQPATTFEYGAASTGLDYLTFSHGKHVCPGRFFATELLKLVLAALIMRYDIKLPPNAKPHKRYFGMHEIPDSNLRILVKATGNR